MIPFGFIATLVSAARDRFLPTPQPEETAIPEKTEVVTPAYVPANDLHTREEMPIRPKRKRKIPISSKSQVDQRTKYSLKTSITDARKRYSKK